MFRIGSSAAIAPLRRTRGLATHVSQATTSALKPTRHDWAKTEIKEIYDTPLLELVFRAASVHRQHHDPSKVQLCTLMNIKSTSCLSLRSEKTYGNFSPWTFFFCSSRRMHGRL